MSSKPTQWYPGINLQQPLARGLVAALPLWEGSGTHVENVAGRQNGVLTLMDNSDWVGTPYGFGLNFDGSNDYVDIQDIIFDQRYDFTLYARFMCTDVAGDNTVISLNEDTNGVSWQAIRVNAGNVEASSRDSGTQAASSAISDNVWYHVVAVFASRTSRKIYVDGQLKAENTTDVPDGRSLNVASLGRFSDLTPSSWFKGQQSEAGIWDRSLSAEEISQFYNLGPGGLYRRSKSIFMFNESVVVSPVSSSRRRRVAAGIYHE